MKVCGKSPRRPQPWQVGEGWRGLRVLGWGLLPQAGEAGWGWEQQLVLRPAGVEAPAAWCKSAFGGSAKPDKHFQSLPAHDD